MASYTEHFNPFVWIKTGEGADRTITSEQLRGYVADETGTGAVVFAGGDIGAATATTPATGDNDTSVATTAFVKAQGYGDVSGPSSSVDSEVALFSGTGGKTIKRASASGIAKVTSGVLSAVTAPSGAIVGDTDTQTLSGKTLTAPIIADFTSAQHDHLDAAGGGQLTTAALSDFVVWTSPTFDAADFTASGTMTWTLAAGDVATYAYLRIGKAMLIAFYLATTSVGGTPSAALRIKVPTGATIAKTMASQFAYNDNGAARVVGTIFAAAGVTYLELYKIDVSNWTAAANTTQVQGQIFIEIQ